MLLPLCALRLGRWRKHEKGTAASWGALYLIKGPKRMVSFAGLFSCPIQGGRRPGLGSWAGLESPPPPLDLGNPDPPYITKHTGAPRRGLGWARYAMCLVIYFTKRTSKAHPRTPPPGRRRNCLRGPGGFGRYVVQRTPERPSDGRVA